MKTLLALLVSFLMLIPAPVLLVHGFMTADAIESVGGLIYTIIIVVGFLVKNE